MLIGIPLRIHVGMSSYNSHRGCRLQLAGTLVSQNTAAYQAAMPGLGAAACNRGSYNILFIYFSSPPIQSSFGQIGLGLIVAELKG